jgi:hypothetical protein
MAKQTAAKKKEVTLRTTEARLERAYLNRNYIVGDGRRVPAGAGFSAGFRAGLRAMKRQIRGT